MFDPIEAVLGGGEADIGEVPIDDGDFVVGGVDLEAADRRVFSATAGVPDVVGMAYFEDFGWIAAGDGKFGVVLADAG